MEQMTILLLGFHVGFTYKLENPPAHGTNKATKNHTSITIKRKFILWVYSIVTSAHQKACIYFYWSFMGIVMGIQWYTV